MKLVSYKQDRVSGDKLKVEAVWRTRMKRPAVVSISRTMHEGQAEPNPVLLEGEASEVYDTMSGIAQIAWAMGWRPPGLTGKLAQFIQDFKPE